MLAEPLERTARLPAVVANSRLLVRAQRGALLDGHGLGRRKNPDAILSIMPAPFGYGILAAVAANGGLWYLLARATIGHSFSIRSSGSIPPAICVLAAAYLNRAHLSEAQLTSIRYASAIVIYVSSTADIFLTGVAQAPWLPFVLAGISLIGIFAGILLRVRSFLFLGTGFLVLALLTVIWYAAVDLDMTWVWSVSASSLAF